MAAVTVAPGLVQVKQEKPDDPEILEMAAKIAEANRIKLAQANAQAAAGPARTLNGAGNLRGYIVAAGGAAGPVLKPVGATVVAASAETEIAVDEPSTRGKFSWTFIGTNSIPVILRRDGKYISVRIMELKVLSVHLNFLHPDIYLQARVPSYAMTEAEYRLLNEINVRHCEGKFGRETFSSKDLVVSLKDAIDFYCFLDVCYHKLQHGATMSQSFGTDKCGFIRINKDSVIPYTVKNGERYVPIFYFEGETDKLKSKSVELSGWELAYLKFCCKVQGIKNELFNNETCAVTSLNDIKSYFSVGDVFEEYWPNKVVDSQLLISQTKHGVTGSNSWIRTPPPGPNAVKAATQGRNGVIAMNGVSGAAWQAAQGVRSTAVPPANVQQQLAAVQRAASMRGVTPGRHQYYTNNQATAAALLVRQQTGAPAHAPTGANMSSAYAKVISNSYSNLAPNGTYKNGVWPQSNGYSSLALQQMIATGQIPAAAYASYQTGSTGQTSQTSVAKTVPPPLIPVMSGGAAAANARTAQQRYPAGMVPQPQPVSKQTAAPASNAEIIDLSSPPNSPQRSAASRNSGQVNGRSAAGMSQMTAHGNAANVLWGRYGSSVEGFQYIPEVSGSTATTGSARPYKVSKVRIGDSVITCINKQPFIYNEDLMTTISDFTGAMAPQVAPKRVVEAFNVLSIKLYVGNRLQLQTLNETKRYTDLFKIVPLISVTDIKEHIGAIQYVLRPENSTNSGGPSAKRSRMS